MNEPVAWFKKLRLWCECAKEDKDAIPLYTHPAKTLTDEEILEIAGENHGEYGSQLVDFARAILRKAQEK